MKRCLMAVLLWTGSLLGQGVPTGGAGDGGSGTVTGGPFTSTKCVTGAGGQAIQTPSSNCSVDSSGNLAASSGSFGGATPTGSGVIVLNGFTSGGFVLQAPDVAGTAVVYTSPTAFLASGALVVGSGTVTCPQPPTGASLPATCYALSFASVPRAIASGTSALGTSSISANSCATVVTTAATGTATTDSIVWTPNADISAVTGYGAASTDGLKVYPYPTANNVNFKVCNGSGSSITPGAVTLNWRVAR